MLGLRLANALRRNRDREATEDFGITAPDPPEELVRELLHAHGARLGCDRCRATGLKIGDGAAPGDAGDWLEAVVCEVCRQAIPDERLSVMPYAKRCVNCQDAEDRGQAPVEPDYCPKCGSLVELRVNRGGGITRYRRVCTGNPPCRL